MCEENQVSSEGAASCTLCGVGTVANDGKTECGMSCSTRVADSDKT